jgi:hypothetical protein
LLCQGSGDDNQLAFSAGQLVYAAVSKLERRRLQQGLSRDTYIVGTLSLKET